ncbi:MAG: RNA polymerase sigma factor [Actinomycetia bacterium]|nr:RNA polymerase sigma factor [Actinomycetes bacterium]
MGVEPVIEQQHVSASELYEESVGLVSAAEFEAFLRVHDQAVRRMAYRLVGGDVDDVLQAAYLKAFEQRRSFRGDSSPQTWLFTIAYRTALDHLRSGRRRAARQQRAATLTEVGDRSDAVADRMAVKAALDELPIDQRVILLLIDGQDMSYDDAATVLGIANGTIASRIHRARAAIKTAIEGNEI